VLLVGFMQQGAAFSADAYCITGTGTAMKKKFPRILMKGVLPLCDEACSHSASMGRQLL
jgi:hypothetical protein